MTIPANSGQGPMTNLGLGHPNIYLQKDYRGDNKWYARVETMVPVGTPEDLAQCEKWFEQADAGGFDAASFLAGRVPAGMDPVAARHMIAAAFGMEFEPKTGKVVRPETTGKFNQPIQPIGFGDRPEAPKS